MENAVQAKAPPLRTPEEFIAWAMPHLPAITRLAARLVPADDRDDVIQEALTRAWHKRAQYDSDRGSPSAWLLAITVDQARKSRRRHRPLALPLDISAHLKSSDLGLDLERAIGRLTGRQRLAVECYYFVGLSIVETGAVMHCSAGTVKSTLFDARRHLGRLLEAES